VYVVLRKVYDIKKTKHLAILFFVHSRFAYSLSFSVLVLLIVQHEWHLVAGHLTTGHSLLGGTRTIIGWQDWCVGPNNMKQLLSVEP